MFGFFKKSDPRHYRRLDDFVWLDPVAKRVGIVSRAKTLAEGGAQVVVCAHSASLFRELRQLLGENMSNPRLVEAYRVRASSLRLPGGDTAPLHLLIAEYAPSPAQDDALLQAINEPDMKKLNVEFHLSLEDESMRDFVPPSLRDLLKKLGLTAAEPMQNPMISKSIATARRKAAERK